MAMLPRREQSAGVAFLAWVCCMSSCAGQVAEEVDAVCQRAAQGQVDLQVGFEELTALWSNSSFADLDLQDSAKSRTTRMYMLSVFEHACDFGPAAEEPDKITLQSAAQAVPGEDAAVEAALAVAEKTVEKAAAVVTDIVQSLSKLRKELGQWRSQIEKWAEVKIDNFTLTVAHAATGLALMDVDIKILYQGLKDSVDIQLEVLADAFEVNCRRLHGALQSRCVDDQMESISAAREELEIVLGESAEKLGEMIKESDRLYGQLGVVTSLSNRYAEKIHDHLNDKDGWLQDKIKELRIKAYALCAITCIIPPVCLVCEATAAGVVEGKEVPAMKQALKETKDALNKLVDSFKELAGKSKNLQVFCKSRGTDMKLAEDKIQKTRYRITRKGISFWKRIVVKLLKQLRDLLQTNLDHMEN